MVPHGYITDVAAVVLTTVACYQDAYLPQCLMDKLMCFINYTEMTRVTGVPFNYLLSRSQLIKV